MISGQYKGVPENVTSKIAFNENDMLTAESNISITYKSDTFFDINKLYLVGKNIQLSELLCNGKAVNFTISSESTYCEEKILLLSGDFSGSELEIKLAAGSVIDLVFADTHIRKATVDFKEIVCHDFVGTGTNLIPTFFSDMGIEGGSNEVFWESTFAR